MIEFSYCEERPAGNFETKCVLEITEVYYNKINNEKLLREPVSNCFYDKHWQGIGLNVSNPFKYHQTDFLQFCHYIFDPSH